MIIVSAGMQKSGSAYFYNILNEILIESGTGVDARKLKKDRGLEGVMQWHNNNVGSLTYLKLLKLWAVSLQSGTFVVKTHEAPGLFTRIMSRLGWIKVVYSYRDPRDVLLSAIDHGKRILSEGENHTFADLVEFDAAMAAVKEWLAIWRVYDDMPGVLSIKYEDMMCNPGAVIEDILKFLGISLAPEAREKILWKYSKDNPEGERTGLHFNKAKPLRYLSDMSDEQRAKCQEAFGGYLSAMGYE